MSPDPAENTDDKGFKRTATFAGLPDDATAVKDYSDEGARFCLQANWPTGQAIHNVTFSPKIDLTFIVH